MCGNIRDSWPACSGAQPIQNASFLPTYCITEKCFMVDRNYPYKPDLCRLVRIFIKHVHKNDGFSDSQSQILFVTGYPCIANNLYEPAVQVIAPDEVLISTKNG